jgi:XFP C-terminal domain
MAVRNDIDRFHLVLDVIDPVPKLGASAVYVQQEMRERLIEHKRSLPRTAPTCRKYRTGGGEILIKSWPKKCLAAGRRDRAALDAGKLAAAPDSCSCAELERLSAVPPARAVAGGT